MNKCFQGSACWLGGELTEIEQRLSQLRGDCSQWLGWIERFVPPERERHTMAAVQLELWASPMALPNQDSTPQQTPQQEAVSKQNSVSKRDPVRKDASGIPKPRQRRDIWAELSGGSIGRLQPAFQSSSSHSLAEAEAAREALLSDQPHSDDKTTALERLRRQVSALETGGKQDYGPRLSCGVRELDQALPGGGLAPGTLVEWVEQDSASGASWLSLLAAKAALDARSDSRGRLVVIDTDATFYPLAAIAAGLPLDRLLIVQPANLADGLWAADQALRNPAVSVVWGVLPVLDDRQARRLQLAAEIGQTMGLWLRPAKALSEPSWADVRWFVRSFQPPTARPFSVSSDACRYLEARLMRCRGGRPGTSVTLQIDSSGRVHHVSSKRQTAAMPLVTQLADPAAATATADTGQARRRLA